MGVESTGSPLLRFRDSTFLSSVRIPNDPSTVFHMQIILRCAHPDPRVHHIGKTATFHAMSRQGFLRFVTYSDKEYATAAELRTPYPYAAHSTEWTPALAYHSFGFNLTELKSLPLGTIGSPAGPSGGHGSVAEIPLTG